MHISLKYIFALILYPLLGILHDMILHKQQRFVNVLAQTNIETIKKTPDWVSFGFCCSSTNRISTKMTKSFDVERTAELQGIAGRTTRLSGRSYGRTTSTLRSLGRTELSALL